MTVQRLVVVGGSLAGLRAVEAARKAGFEGSITLIGADRTSADSNVQPRSAATSPSPVAIRWRLSQAWPLDFSWAVAAALDAVPLDLRVGQRDRRLPLRRVRQP